MHWFFPTAALTGVAGLAALTLFTARPEAARASASQAQPSRASRCQDADHDGYGLGCAAGPDCNDQDPAIHPGQKEVCNLRDDDCSGLVDDSPSCPTPTPVPMSIQLPQSTLLMGSPPDQGAADERPLHRVQVSAFSIDRYEVTNQRYAACVQAGVCSLPKLRSSAKRERYFDQAEFAHYPVVFVGWEQADRFCRWDKGRLPTEAEWELAARGPAPSTRVFPWGDEPADCTKANMGGPQSCVGDTDLVGRRPTGASPWGVMDLAGNVWEWTADWYDAAYYSRTPARDPRGPANGRLKVMRGGCWASGADSLRVSCRKAELPGTWAPNVGFRCVRPEGS
jgi:formylglycine-generating enzyme required for sulfatase activity